MPLTNTSTWYPKGGMRAIVARPGCVAMMNTRTAPNRKVTEAKMGREICHERKQQQPDQGSPGSRARRVDRGKERLPGKRKGIYAPARRTEQAAARVAVGARGKGIHLRQS